MTANAHRRHIIVVFTAAMMLTTLGSTAAFAASDPVEIEDGYYTFAWELPMTSTEWNDAGQPLYDEQNGIIWPQAYVTHVSTGHAPDLGALDEQLPDCGVFQVDVYLVDDEDDKAKVAAFVGGTLNWGDDHGEGGVIIGGDEGTAWKLIDNGDCTPPPPPPTAQSATVSVDGVCVVNEVGTASGRFTVTISPAGAATVTINGQAVANGGSIVLPDNSTYPVTAVANAGWTLVGGAPDEVGVGECPEQQVEADVLGTTITTVHEVSADTLPFTGFQGGDAARLGLLSMLAGGLLLFAVCGKKEEEVAVTDIGGWSTL